MSGPGHQGPAPAGGLGTIHFLPFPVPRGCTHSLAQAPCHCVPGSHCRVSCTSDPPAASCKDAVTTLGPPRSSRTTRLKVPT